MKKVSVSLALLTLVFAVMVVPALARAADTGEMWEMTSQMQMAGMPAGAIPAQTQQVCTSQDMREAHGNKDSKCTISDLKESPTRVTYTIRCEGNPPTTGSAEFNFEQNRSRMKGTMRIQSRDGEMTMQMSGRKLGQACDPQQARGAQDKKMAAMKQQMDGQMKAADDQQIKNCADGLEKMNPGGFGMVGMCYKKNDANCQSMTASTSPTVKSACTEKLGQFCGRLQTRAGVEKVGGLRSSNAAAGVKTCGVSLDNVRAQVCPGAVKDNALVFVAHNCPAEAKVIAQKNCAGRSFTSLDEKYGQFCGAYRSTVASSNADDEPAAAGGQGRSSARTDARKAQPEAAPSSDAAKPAATPADQMKEGLGKLKGLFGR